MDSERIIGIVKAKALLENEGYHVGNLWRTEDVCDRYDCTEEVAEEVLEAVLESHYVCEIIFEMIDHEAEEMNIKRLEDE